MIKYKEAQYAKALQSEHLDSSDYILLNIVFFSDVMGVKTLKNGKMEGDGNAVNAIKDLQLDYIKLDYKSAMQKINKLCEDNASKIDNKKLLELIKKKQQSLKNVPEENQSRRYFETNLANAMWNDQNETSFESVEKLGKIIMEMEPKYNFPSKINSLSDSEKVLSTIRDFGDKTKVVTEKRKEFRRVKGALSEIKDRDDTKEKGKLNVGEKNESVIDTDVPLSMNPGIVKASAPLPMDELTTVTKGKITDVGYIGLTKDKNVGYSGTKTEVPFVNSVSGTAYSLATTLHFYIEKHKNDTTLEKDVNNIVKSWVGFTCKKGFHSFGEMLDVLNEAKVVKEVFQDNKISLDRDFYPAKINEVFDKATSYSKVINLKKTLGDEIKTFDKSNLEKTPSITYSEKTPYPATLVEYGVNKRAATDDNVARAITQIQKEKGDKVALSVIDQFVSYAKEVNIKLDAVPKLQKEISSEINKENIDINIERSKNNRPEQ